ncbi:dienelactone hydrolase family protein [Kribbella solani]|uniref:Carboxymethylenebutenolidase n=1 Tax=Kribbella solani TaxID=236067 RepID=A0A841DUT4_9ACTN|nr:dienelactone hydrolase family protein [Kribbella solani]MBB5980037.1 carboxymethylenebutenolidase [Kribbella solani]
MSEDITAGRIKVGELNAYLARPTAPHTGGMLLLPMLSGLGKQLRTYAEDVARTGVAALAWDPWHGPTGDELDHEQLRGLLGGLKDPTALEEQKTLLDHMFGELGLAKVGVMGWCLGGRYALVLAAHDHRVASCVAYHPTVMPEPTPAQDEDAVALASEITCPTSLIYPGADHIVPLESFKLLQKALNKRESAPSVVHIYPGAGHGFMEAGRQDQEANRLATKLSWPQTLEFVRATVS